MRSSILLAILATWKRLLIRLGLRKPKPFSMEDYLAHVEHIKDEISKMTGISEAMLGKRHE